MFFTLLQIVREGAAIWTGKRTSQVSRWLLAAQMFDYLTSKTKSVRIAHFSFTNFPVFSLQLINFLIKDFSFIIGIYFTAIFVWRQIQILIFGGKFKIHNLLDPCPTTHPTKRTPFRRVLLPLPKPSLSTLSIKNFKGQGVDYF